jgi:hypothetical protein
VTKLDELEIAEDRLIYVYALLGDAVPAGWWTEGLNGRDAEVLGVPGTQFRALVQSVDAAIWTGAGADERLQDVEWVGPRAYRHEALVEQIDDRGAVFPMRFATLFSGTEALVDRLTARRRAITEFLDEATDHGEWSVKGHLDRATASAKLGSGARDASQSSSGADYLKRRAEKQSTGEQVEEWVREVAPPMFDAFAAVATDAAVRTGVDGPDDDTETAFHWAFWVPDAQLEQWTGVQDRLPESVRETGLELAVEGPWPGYSFRPTFDDR